MIYLLTLAFAFFAGLGTGMFLLGLCVAAADDSDRKPR